MTDVPKVVQATPNFVERAFAHVQTIRVLGSFVQASRAFSEDRCSMIAAALSYYTLLSIFPLLLFLVAIASFFLQSENALRVVIGFLNEFLPQSSAAIRSNLQEVTRVRGSITLVAAAGLFWSASGVFNNVQLGLNRVFRVQRTRPMWRERLVSMAMVAGIGVLFGISFAITTSLRLAFHIRQIRSDLSFEIASTIIAALLAAIVFALMYRFVPYDPAIRWRAVLVSALIAAVLWESAKIGFVWYLTNVNQLNLVYGSIGAIIALMIWGYISWVIVLYCAEVAAVRMGVHQRQVTGKEWWAAIAS
jgi:membrane protein